MATFLCLYSTLIFAVNAQVFPAILTRLGGTSVQQGFLLTSLFLLFPFSSAFAGLAADRIGKRNVLIIGSVFLALPFCFSALVKKLWMRTLSVLLFGIGSGIVEGQTSALLTDIHPGRERSILNLAQVFFCIGAASGPFIIATAYRIRPDLKIPSLMWAVALVTATTVIGFFFLKGRTSNSASINTVGFKNVLKDRDGRLLLLAIFVYVAPEMGTAGWIAKYCEEHLILSKTAAPMALTLFWGGLGLSRILVGLTLHSIEDDHLLYFTLLFTFFTHTAAFLLKTSLPVLIFIFLAGFGMGAVWPTLVAMIGKRFKESSGSAIGLMIAAGAFASPVIHQVIGFLSREDLLGLRYTLLSLGILNLLNIYIIRKIGKRQTAESKPQ